MILDFILVLAIVAGGVGAFRSRKRALGVY